ncbi:hypothetical protein PUNSTDRAFT_113017 [Punctularia strigosozonata HHB-11173 SS5]|uniref:uncharacterized protein n=1 Tax=Punctularia strigosozonata (strain HHB-11173) TaxID=741275 RepID=UPI00044167E2|nr:uncharacterized protein PUNSTDRAFT_113017 [Punctularia strigosozonata HHB-11173 SS5]EIN09567.1 hypothetical protein PUNSTDRAFT_113017 [Punctularia strigosozonata HHB-11173 SS5]
MPPKNASVGCFTGLLSGLRLSKTGARAAQTSGSSVAAHGTCKTNSNAMAIGSVYRPEVMETIEKTLDMLDPELRKLSLQIHDHPEIMFEEKYAHDTLTEFMASHGFEVTKHYLDMDTAWRAEFSHKEGGRVLGVNSEMDALPKIGHACGHNLIAISGVGVALAVKAALQKHDVPGKVVLLGTPAEEGGGGKLVLLDRGGYKEMDACVMCHPGPGPAHSVGLGPSLAMQALEIEFFGHTSHAAAAPWEGTNSLDAAFLAYSSVAVLRQQIKPTHRVHGVVRGKDLPANVIPDYVQMLWYVRALTAAELDELRERVINCFRGAALSSGCKIKINEHPANLDLRQNTALAHDFANTIKQRYEMNTTFSEGAVGGSTDFGNVTYGMSSSIPTVPNGGNHTPEFTDAARTKAAHKETMDVTKGLALTGFRMLDDNDFFYSVKKAFDDERKL